MATSPVQKSCLKPPSIVVPEGPTPFPTHELPQVSSENGQLIATIYGQRYVVTTTLDGIDITNQRDWTGVAEKVAKFFSHFSNTQVKNAETGEPKPLSCELKIKSYDQMGNPFCRSISGREVGDSLTEGRLDDSFVCFVEEKEESAPKPRVPKRVCLTEVDSRREFYQTARSRIAPISTLDQHLSSLIPLQVHLRGFWGRHGITLRYHAAAVIRQMPSVDVDSSWYEKLVQRQVFSSILSVKENIANYIEEFGVDDAPFLLPLFLKAVLTPPPLQEAQKEQEEVQEAISNPHDPVLRPILHRYEHDQLGEVFRALCSIPKPQLYLEVVKWARNEDFPIDQEQLLQTLELSIDQVETFFEGVVRKFVLGNFESTNQRNLVCVFRDYLIAQAKDYEYLFDSIEVCHSFLQYFQGTIDEISAIHCLPTFDRLGPLRRSSLERLKQNNPDFEEFIEFLQKVRSEARLDLVENVDQELAKKSMEKEGFTLTDSYAELEVQLRAKALRKYAQAVLTHNFATQESFAELAPFLTKIEELSIREDSIFARHWQGSEWFQVRAALINAFEEGIDIELNKLFLFLFDHPFGNISVEVLKETGMYNTPMFAFFRKTYWDQLATRWNEIEKNSPSHYVRDLYQIRLTPSRDERVAKALCHYVAKKLEEQPALAEGIISRENQESWIRWLRDLSDVGRQFGESLVKLFQDVLRNRTLLSEEGAQAVIMEFGGHPDVVSFVNKLQGTK